MVKPTDFKYEVNNSSGGYTYGNIATFMAQLNNPISIFLQRDQANIDGYPCFTMQGRTGDCYALGTGNALKNSEAGKSNYSGLVSQDPLSGMYSFQFKDEDKKYYFTSREIISSEVRLSVGDDDMKLFELAYEQRRVEKLNEMVKIAGSEEEYVRLSQNIKKEFENMRQGNLSNFDDNGNLIVNNDPKEVEFRKLYMKNLNEGLVIDDPKRPLDGGQPGEVLKAMFGDNISVTAYDNVESNPGMPMPMPGPSPSPDPVTDGPVPKPAASGEPVCKKEIIPSSGEENKISNNPFGITPGVAENNSKLTNSVEQSPLIEMKKMIQEKLQTASGKDKEMLEAKLAQVEKYMQNIEQAKMEQEAIQETMQETLRAAMKEQLKARLGCDPLDVKNVQITSIRALGDPTKQAMTIDFKKTQGEVITKHCYTIVAADDEFVTLVNPWNSAAELKIANTEEFRRNIQRVTVGTFREKPEDSSEVALKISQ